MKVRAMKWVRGGIMGLVAVALWGLTARCWGQGPVIDSLGRNGVLVCTNLEPGSEAVVEWASSVEGPWTNTWAGLDSVEVDLAGTIRVAVPMFYRVRGVPRFPGMAYLPPGTDGGSWELRAERVWAI